MKDIEGTMRRLDEEIVGHHQRIAAHQVEIMRLQDTRKVLMRLVEGDHHAAEQAKLEHAGVVNGAHAKPVLIVRREGSGDEEGTESHLRKTGKKPRDYEHERAMKAARKAKQQQEEVKRRWVQPNSQAEQLRNRVIEALKQGPLSTAQMRDQLAIDGNWSDNRGPMKAFTNAIYQLTRKGDLIRNNDDMTYRLK